MYIQARQVFLGRWDEVWFHRFPSPPSGFPFSSFSLDTLLFVFFPFMSSLASCPVISSLSFFCVHTARPLVCTRTTYFQLRLQVAQVLTMRWVVIGCSCALGSFSLQPHTHTFVLSCLLFLSPFFCFTVHTLTLLPCFSPMLGEARVCVCIPWNHRDPLGLFLKVVTVAGGSSPS